MLTDLRYALGQLEGVLASPTWAVPCGRLDCAKRAKDALDRAISREQARLDAETEIDELFAAGEDWTVDEILSREG